MKISGLIKKLEALKAQHGDVEVYTIANDGHASWAEPADVNIKKYTASWPPSCTGKFVINA